MRRTREQFGRRAVALLAVAAGMAGVLAGCGGDGTGRDRYADMPDKQGQGDRVDPGDGEGEAGAPTPTTPPTPVAFEQVKGEALKYKLTGGFTVLAKPMSAEWTGQFDDQPADPGSKFLVVFVALKPELTDRGVSRFKFDRGVDLRFAPANGGCESTTGTSIRVRNVLHCAIGSRVFLESKPLSDPSWAGGPWVSAEYTGTDLQPGVSYVTALAYPVPDELEVEGGFKLCDKSYEYGAGEATDPCVPIPAVPARG